MATPEEVLLQKTQAYTKICSELSDSEACEQAMIAAMARVDEERARLESQRNIIVSEIRELNYKSLKLLKAKQDAAREKAKAEDLVKRGRAGTMREKGQAQEEEKGGAAGGAGAQTMAGDGGEMDAFEARKAEMWEGADGKARTTAKMMGGGCGPATSTRTTETRNATMIGPAMTSTTSGAGGSAMTRGMDEPVTMTTVEARQAATMRGADERLISRTAQESVGGAVGAKVKKASGTATTMVGEACRRESMETSAASRGAPRAVALAGPKIFPVWAATEEQQASLVTKRPKVETPAILNTVLHEKQLVSYDESAEITPTYDAVGNTGSNVVIWNQSTSRELTYGKLVERAVQQSSDALIAQGLIYMRTLFDKLKEMLRKSDIYMSQEELEGVLWDLAFRLSKRIDSGTPRHDWFFWLSEDIAHQLYEKRQVRLKSVPDIADFIRRKRVAGAASVVL